MSSAVEWRGIRLRVDEVPRDKGNALSISIDGITNAEDDLAVPAETSVNIERDPRGVSSMTDNDICLKTAVFAEDVCVAPDKLVSVGEVHVQGIQRVQEERRHAADSIARRWECFRTATCSREVTCR